MAGRSRSSRSATHQELWQMAKYWLASSNVLPPGHKVYEGSPTVFDLAHSLRDGVALCQIANCLRPYSVRDINLKPQMSPVSCPYPRAERLGYVCTGPPLLENRFPSSHLGRFRREIVAFLAKGIVKTATVYLRGYTCDLNWLHEY